MNEIEKYIRKVIDNLYVSAENQKRIKADLKEHFTAAQEAGEPIQTIIENLGNPVEVAAEFMSQVKLNYAGFWVRVWAFLIDLILLIVIALLLCFLFVWFGNMVPSNPGSFIEYTEGGLLILMTIVSGMSLLGLFILYFPILEGRFGQTLGKKLFGLRVLKEGGMPIGYKEAFIRRLSLFFEFLPIDALFIPFNEKCQRAFDIIAKTVVVKVSEEQI